MTISIKISAADLSELVGKKLVGIDGDSYSLQLTFENGPTLNIASNAGNDEYDSPVAASLVFELSYAHSNNC